MSKAILISIKPKWCAKIMNGEKTIEVRKNKALANAIQKLIDENGYADIYVYCSKDDDLGCIKKISKDKYVCGKDFDIKDFNYLASGYNGKGKVVFKFRCYKMEEISWQIGLYELDQQPFSDFLDKSCLGFCELKNYLNKKNGFAINIADLEIFDKPKELSEFYTTKLDEDLIKRLDNSIQLENGTWVKRITKAPQNMCYVEIGK